MEISFLVYRNKAKLPPKALDSPVDGHVSATASSKITVASKKVKEYMERKVKIFNIGYAIL